MSVMRDSRSSSYVIREAILKFYDDKKLWPRGITSAMECIQDWGLRMGDAIKRMATQLPSRIAVDSNVAFHDSCRMPS